MNKILIEVTAKATMPDGTIRVFSTSVYSPEMSAIMLKDPARVESVCEKTLDVACSHVQEEALYFGNQQWNRLQADMFAHQDVTDPR